MKISELRAWGLARLQNAGIENAVNESLWMLETALAWDRLKILTEGNASADPLKEEAYKSMIMRRCSKEPFQYITGEQQFCGMTFKVSPSVLIPRFETEELVACLVSRFGEGSKGKLLEIGTGSGCIPIVLLDRLKHWTGVSVDISTEALAIAEVNSRMHLADGRLKLLHGDCLSPVVEKDFDLIVSNPPYIETEELKELSTEVTGHEPIGALDGGADGLDFYRRIVSEAGAYLKKGGLLAFEIGYNQKSSVEALLDKAGFSAIETRKDLYGQDRIVLAVWDK